MEGYLGDFDIELKDTKFKDYTKENWAMYWIGSYGQIDGDHHKLWVLDQVARILKGTPVIVKEARWANGHKEYREWLGEPTQEYLDWIKMMKGKYDEENDEYEYDYDEGIAP